MVRLRIYLLTLVLVVGLIGSCTLVDDEEIVTSIEILNMTNVAFNRLLIREMGASSWRIDQSVLIFPGSHPIELSRNLYIDTRYEVQLRTFEGRTATKSNILLEQGNIVMFETKDFDDDGGNEITAINILNETGIDFTYVYIGESGSQSFLFKRAGAFSNGNHVSISGINPPLDPNKFYDIRLQEHEYSGISATKNNVELKQNGVVRFESSDLD